MAQHSHNDREQGVVGFTGTTTDEAQKALDEALCREVRDLKGRDTRTGGANRKAGGAAADQ